MRRVKAMAHAATHTVSGIGLAVVEDLVAKEWNVAVFDFEGTAGNALAKKLGERVLFIQGNVIKYDELVTAFDRTFNHWGRIDLVFANAVCTSSINLTKGVNTYTGSRSSLSRCEHTQIKIVTSLIPCRFCKRMR